LDLAVENITQAAPGDPRLLAIVASLEHQLAALDAIGARIAAAHLDAAIQQLRLDQARR
jgi:hypothetical protein